MELTGYSDRWTVRPGEEIGFHIHCVARTYEARLVRLIHGDENPRGPGRKQVRVASTVDGIHAGRVQTIDKGSFGAVEIGDLLTGVERFTVSTWIWPTLPGPEAQGIVSWLTGPKGEGLGIFLSPDGHIECLRPGTAPLRSARALSVREWYRLAVTVDVSSGTAALEVSAQRWSPQFERPDRVEAQLGHMALPQADDTLLFAAGWREGKAGRALFNGKIARPRIETANGILCAWDFAQRQGTTEIVDIGGSGRHGRLVNRPARAMTGPDWPGASTSTAALSDTHDAIHFHDDDVADVDWPESLRLRVPDDLPTGVYALQLQAGEIEDHLPFFVCPPAGSSRPSLAVLMPTMSYLAYANESPDMAEVVQLAPLQDMSISAPAYAYVAENGLKSTYDLHRDGSGIIHGSRRRPIIDFRPDFRCRTFDAPHQFPADLHLIDWLTVKGYEFDVITDDLLHDEGRSVLAPYRVVMTGSHPEYWTRRMLDARDGWLDDGGRLMYLGGNGFYWVTGVAEDDPSVIEIRRYAGTRTSTGDIGEETLSVSGERGGLWRDRGRSPHSRLGIGFAGQGFDRGTYYRRAPASFAPEWSWIFQGVENDVFGGGRALVLGHGAAGFEVDKADARYGTPAHTVVLASADRFTDAYQAAIETMNSVNPWTGGSHPASGVRSDIVYTAGPNGGAVFAAGSISWSSTLSQEGYASDTSHITKNVLDVFLGE